MPETVTEAEVQASLPPYVRLANELAAQFPLRSDDEAAATVAAHIRRYWEPRMRRDLDAYLGSGGDGLVPVARAAAVLLRTR